MSRYRMKVVYRTTLGVTAYLVLAWFADRLSWPVAAGAFIYWLLVPYAVMWAWPEDDTGPFWGRAILSVIVIGSVTALGIVNQI